MDSYRIQKSSIYNEGGRWFGWCLNRCAWVSRPSEFDEREIWEVE